MATKTEMLTNVEAAIDALVTGRVKAVTVNEQQFTMNTLGELQRWRSTLVSEIKASQSGGMVKFASIEDFR